MERSTFPTTMNTGGNFGKLLGVNYSNENQNWCKLITLIFRRQYQGLKAPNNRTEENFDAGAKFHVPNNVEYLRYSLVNFDFYQRKFFQSWRSQIYKTTSTLSDISSAQSSNFSSIVRSARRLANMTRKTLLNRCITVTFTKVKQQERN